MFSEQYGSQLKSLHVLLIHITEFLEWKCKAPYCIQFHQNIHTGFVTIGHKIQKFKRYRQTHKDTRTEWRC